MSDLAQPRKTPLVIYRRRHRISQYSRYYWTLKGARKAVDKYGDALWNGFVVERAEIGPFEEVAYD